MGFTTYTCVINDDTKQIRIDGRPYSLVPIPVEPKKTLSDKIYKIPATRNSPADIEVVEVEDIKEFIDKIKKEVCEEEIDIELVDELVGPRFK